MPKENFTAILETWEGKHTIKTKRIKYSCARKEKIDGSCLQKNLQVYLIKLVNGGHDGTLALLENITHVTHLWIISAKKGTWYTIETMCLWFSKNSYIYQHL